ncbi:MAG: methylenetetrahydrofolate reductase C-terminal domain-containing protein [Actinomycetes bacterium]
MPQFIASLEHVIKGPMWDCQMCGQCVLHSTGMTCPMTCPKTLRNGPCGGVREDGNCEVKPEMRCVWTKAYERTQDWPLPSSWKDEFNHLRPPVDNRLKGGSSWKNFLSKRDKWTPSGWKNATSESEH